LGVVPGNHCGQRRGMLFSTVRNPVLDGAECEQR
jgi:hypothetical protein